MHVTTTTSPAEFVEVALAHVRDVIENTDGQITIGLSGGSTPVSLYTELGKDDSLPWDRMQFFLVDDRYVLADHKDSNQTLVRDSLLMSNHAVFIAPNTSLAINECIEGYEQAVSSLTPDLVILGMGPDGHIASLFPPLLPEAFGSRNVIHTTTDAFAVRDRISVTLPFLERAKKRLFLISGKEKIDLFRKHEHENQDPSMFPAHALFDGRTTWVLGK